MTGGMDTDALKTFIQTYAAGSLAGAARRLKITSMAATRRLAGLEAELGVRLMHRSTRSVSLTPEGETFLPYATSIVDAPYCSPASRAPPGCCVRRSPPPSAARW
jgi:DNA-binding transcriptional LysR family regulator